jgi:hypothetical protein
VANKIQFRRDTASNWTSANPTLSSGEFGFESDTNRFKIGDGSTAWSSLGYLDGMSTGGGTFTGDVTFQGTSYDVLWDVSQNSMEWADNAKATFGDSRDLQIYHNGSNSVIKDDGAGDLNIQGDATINFLNAAGTEYKLRAYTDGAVNLYYDNSVKIATTSTGVSVTGTADMTALSIGGTAVTSTAAELNILDGVTATTAELNILDGVTATTAELNILDGVTATTAELNILDGVTATTAELNILDGVTATTAELNILDGVTATTAELNFVDGVTSSIQTQLNAKAPTSAPTLTNLTLVGTTVEDVYAMSGTSVALEPDNGSIQTHTLTGNTTYTDAFSAGQAITIMIDDGSAYTVTWPTMTWVNNAGSAPTLATTGYTVVALWKVSTTLYGALVGDGT